jgi:hypothetical protein
MQKILPLHLISSLSRDRAALLPATDLVATLSEAVLLFSSIEEHVFTVVRQPQQESFVSFTDQYAKWVKRLGTATDVLDYYTHVLRWQVCMVFDLNGNANCV